MSVEKLRAEIETLNVLLESEIQRYLEITVNKQIIKEIVQNKTNIEYIKNLKKKENFELYNVNSKIFEYIDKINLCCDKCKEIFTELTDKFIIDSSYTDIYSRIYSNIYNNITSHFEATESLINELLFISALSKISYKIKTDEIKAKLKTVCIKKDMILQQIKEFMGNNKIPILIYIPFENKEMIKRLFEENEQLKKELYL